MSKQDMSFWEAVNTRFARGDDIIIKIKHEDTGRGWIALAIAFIGVIALYIAEKRL